MVAATDPSVPLLIDSTVAFPYLASLRLKVFQTFAFKCARVHLYPTLVLVDLSTIHSVQLGEHVVVQNWMPWP